MGSPLCLCDLEQTVHSLQVSSLTCNTGIVPPSLGRRRHDRIHLCNIVGTAPGTSCIFHQCQVSLLQFRSSGPEPKWDNVCECVSQAAKTHTNLACSCYKAVLLVESKTQEVNYSENKREQVVQHDKGTVYPDRSRDCSCWNQQIGPHAARLLSSLPTPMTVS